MLLCLVPPPGALLLPGARSPVLTAAAGFRWALPQPGAAAMQSFPRRRSCGFPPLFPEQKRCCLFLFLMQAPAQSVVWQRGPGQPRNRGAAHKEAGSLLQLLPSGTSPAAPRGTQLGTSGGLLSPPS